MVRIEPATKLRTNYNLIAEIAKKTGDSIYITRNGVADVVLMSVSAFENRDTVLRLGHIVLQAEKNRLLNETAFSLEESMSILNDEYFV